ncbi:MAG: hypothetical protein ACYTJ0_09185 [Planctomycetota bacterium]|jgi:hypothetical protein
MRGLRALLPLIVVSLVAAGFAPPAVQTHRIDGFMRAGCLGMTAERLVVDGWTIDCGCLDGELTTVLERHVYPGGWELWVGEGQICTEDGFVCTMDVICICPTVSPDTVLWIGQHAIMSGQGTGIVSGWLQTTGYVNTVSGAVGVDVRGEVEVLSRDALPAAEPGFGED